VKGMDILKRDVL